jgi:hypothetical protein
MAAYFVNAMFLELRYFEYINVLYFFLMGTMVGMYERFQQSGLQAQFLPDEAEVETRLSIPWPEARAPRAVEGA